MHMPPQNFKSILLILSCICFLPQLGMTQDGAPTFLNELPIPYLGVHQCSDKKVKHIIFH